MYLLSATDVIIDAEKLQDVAQDVTQKAKEAVPEDVTERIGLFQQYMNQLPEKAFGLGIRIVFAIITLFLGIQVIKLIRRILKRSLEKGKADAGVVQFLDSFVKAVLTILLIFTIAINFGVDAASIVAILGSMGVAISLALQGSLSNFAGGVLILLLKPFKVGDYIKENGHGNEGTVTEIQLFYTKLLTIEKHVVVLPNGALANTSLINYTETPTRRVDLKVGIAYDADLKKAKEVILNVLHEDSYVVQEEPMWVYVSQLGDSAVELSLYCFVKCADWVSAKGVMLEKIKLALDENDIRIPYPQMDVHLNNHAK
ncbi:MAG: mechanosensitive ion channel [Lachnospiraceae bacterium]|nr:mechanosensitive ion channel [Lachnospiraceae bacterium]